MSRIKDLLRNKNFVFDKFYFQQILILLVGTNFWIY
jgi:hypothetical protein